MKFSVYIANLKAYNEGYPRGKWLDLPVNVRHGEDIEEALEKELASIGVGKLGEPGITSEEFFIADYENNIDYKVPQHQSLYDLNYLAQELSKIEFTGQAELNWVLAYHETLGGTMFEALDHYHEYSFHPEMTVYDVAKDAVENGMYGQIPPAIQNAINYNHLAESDFDYLQDTKYGCISVRKNR